MDFPDVLTIKGTVTRSRADGYPVTENALRSWVKKGLLPAVWTGKKALIYYPNFISLLRTGIPIINSVDITGKIRRIEP
jgi:hypothetical protein